MLRSLFTLLYFALIVIPSSAQQLPSSGTTAEALPGIDQILERYQKAVGDKTVAEKLTSVEMKGTIEVLSAGLSGTTEIYQKAPDKQYQSSDLPGFGVVRTGFDGKAGWVQFPDGVRDATGNQPASMKRNSLMLRDYMFKDLYPKMSVKGREKAGDRDAIVVEATPSEGSAETLYFDTQTGLLTHVDGETEGPEGSLSSEMYFEDYRDVGGIKRPFTIRQTTPSYTVIIKFSEMKNDVTIEDSKFVKPAAQ